MDGDGGVPQAEVVRSSSATAVRRPAAASFGPNFTRSTDFTTYHLYFRYVVSLVLLTLCSFRVGFFDNHGLFNLN